MTTSSNPRWDADGRGWELDRVHFDRPVTALTRSYYLEPIAEGSERGFAAWSLPVDRYRYVVVNGWAYGRSEPLGGDPPAILEKLPILAHLWRIDPRARGRIRGFDRFVRDGGFERNISRWDDEWRPEAERRIAALRALDTSSASDAELADHLDAWRDFVLWTWTFHLNIHLVCFYVRAKFRDVCRRTLDLSDFEAYELIKRSDPVLLQGSARLSELAARADRDATLREALSLPADQALRELRGTWLDEALADFLEGEGDRASSFDLSDPTWREMPDLVLTMLKGMIDAGYDPAAEDAAFQQWRTARIAELRGRLGGDDRAEFDRWLAYGERAYPLNETHNRLLAELPWALIRYAALEAGRRLVARGHAGARDDVFHLSADELIGALRDPGRDVRPLIAEHRRDHEWAATLEPPATIGGPPSEPPYHALPPAVAATFRALLDQTAEMLGERGRSAGAGELAGSPGSPGSAEGPVRVVRGIEEFGKVRPGDVLVCPLTNPAWTVLFPQVAAIVTDSGGPLSHAAIVAREYGVPSVVGTLDATRRLEDGQRVAVNGDAGVVRELHVAAAAGT
jgi:rifampicin phosphotransferase